MAYACSRQCLETAIHEARKTKAALVRSRRGVRTALAHYHAADRRLERALGRVQGVPHPKRLDLKRFGEHEVTELMRLERELRELRPFVPKKMPPKKRRAPKRRSKRK